MGVVSAAHGVANVRWPCARRHWRRLWVQEGFARRAAPLGKAWGRGACTAGAAGAAKTCLAVCATARIKGHTGPHVQREVALRPAPIKFDAVEPKLVEGGDVPFVVDGQRRFLPAFAAVEVPPRLEPQGVHSPDEARHVREGARHRGPAARAVLRPVNTRTAPLPTFVYPHGAVPEVAKARVAVRCATLGQSLRLPTSRDVHNHVPAGVAGAWGVRVTR